MSLNPASARDRRRNRFIDLSNTKQAQITMAMTLLTTTVLDVLTDMWTEAKYTACSKNRNNVVNE